MGKMGLHPHVVELTSLAQLGALARRPCGLRRKPAPLTVPLEAHRDRVPPLSLRGA